MRNGSPGTVPSTGGPPATDGGIISLPLLLAFVGALVVVGGGATVLVAGRAR